MKSSASNQVTELKTKKQKVLAKCVPGLNNYLSNTRRPKNIGGQVFLPNLISTKFCSIGLILNIFNMTRPKMCSRLFIKEFLITSWSIFCIVTKILYDKSRRPLLIFTFSWRPKTRLCSSDIPGITCLLH